MSEMIMAILLACLTSGVTYGKISLSWPQNGSHFKKCQNIKHSFNLTSDMTGSSQIMSEKVLFMAMTSSMASQGDFKINLYIHV